MDEEYKYLIKLLFDNTAKAVSRFTELLGKNWIYADTLMDFCFYQVGDHFQTMFFVYVKTKGVQSAFNYLIVKRNPLYYHGLWQLAWPVLQSFDRKELASAFNGVYRDAPLECAEAMLKLIPSSIWAENKPWVNCCKGMIRYNEPLLLMMLLSQKDAITPYMASTYGINVGAILLIDSEIAVITEVSNEKATVYISDRFIKIDINVLRNML